MTLDELDKNSKYGYRRKSWRKDQYESYIAFSGTQWIFVSEKGQAETLDSTNVKAEDWYLSDIPNKFYKEPEFPCFRRSKHDSAVVEFTAPSKGTVVVAGGKWKVGTSHNEWVPYDSDITWIPCEDPRKRKFKVGDVIRRINTNYDADNYTITSITKDCYYVNNGRNFSLFSDEDKYELVTSSCSSEPTTPTQKENRMDLRLLLAMMAAMSNEETPKDATNSTFVIIITKDDAYEGYFYADDLESVKAIVAEPKNELKKFHVFDYQTTLGQKPRKVIQVERS